MRHSIHEKVEFVGYFLKLISYEDALGTTRWAPLLIGRLRLRENSAQFAQRRIDSENRAVPWLIGGAVLLFAVVAIWTRRYLGQSSLAGLEPVPTDHAAIEHWLGSGAETSNLEETGWEPFSDETEPRPTTLTKLESPPTSGDASATSLT